MLVPAHGVSEVVRGGSCAGFVCVHVFAEARLSCRTAIGIARATAAHGRWHLRRGAGGFCLSGTWASCGVADAYSKKGG